MKARRLAISPDLWVEMLTRSEPQRFEVYKNRLPEDAKCVKMDVDRESDRVYLWITSSVFRDDDPTDLLAPHIRNLPDPETKAR
jgi:hypothetical protein